MIDLDQLHMIYLDYSCGCRDSWTIGTPADPDEVTVTIPEPCVPDHCGTCEAAGRMCADREALVRFKPIEFSEVTPVRRVVRRKASA